MRRWGFELAGGGIEKPEKRGKEEKQKEEASLVGSRAGPWLGLVRLSRGGDARFGKAPIVDQRSKNRDRARHEEKGRKRGKKIKDK